MRRRADNDASSSDAAALLAVTSVNSGNDEGDKNNGNKKMKSGVVVADGRGGGGNDDLTFGDMAPALLVAVLVSIGSFLACGGDDGDESSIELAEDILVATIRTVVQLSLLSAVLSRLFRLAEREGEEASSPPSVPRGLCSKLLSGPAVVLAYVFGFMLPLAAHEASARSALTVPNARRSVLIAFASAVSSMGSVAIFAIVRPSPRHSPRHVVPLCGMLLNNAVAGTSLALDRILDELKGGGRASIEILLAFGADVPAATRPALRRVLSGALKPTINTMNVIGLVAIPGMMTGQVLGGASPARAARYQIVIMCLILGGTFLSAGITTELIIRETFDERGVFREDVITRNTSPRISQLLSSPSVIGFGFGGESPPSSDAEDESDTRTVIVEMSAGEAGSPPPKSDGPPLLEVRLLGTFANAKRTLRVDGFTVGSPGEVAIIRGDSGVGKSTFLKAVAELGSSGFVAALGGEDPASTSASLLGRDRASFDPTEWRRRVTYVPQGGGAGLSGTPSDLLNAAASARGFVSGSTERRTLHDSAASLAKAWGLDPPAYAMSRPWSELSGGESQRALLAVAVASEPDVLLLDEPTSALDGETRRAVEESLKSTGCAIVMVTHDEEQANRLGTSHWRLEAVGVE